MTSLSSFGSRSTMARRISSSSSSRRRRAVASISRSSGSSSPSSSSSCAPAASSAARRHSSASLAAPSRRAVLAPDLGVALAVADDLGVGHRARQLGEARLDLLDERLDHATTSMPILSLVGDVARSSTAAPPPWRRWRRRAASRSGSRVSASAAAGPGTHARAPHPAPAAVAPGELDDLERDAGDQRDADDARERRASTRRAGRSGRRRRSPRSSRSSRKLVPQRGCRRQKRWAFSGVSSSPRLVAGDRLVLGAVVLEDAAQVAQAREQQQVAEEDRGAHDRPRRARRGTTSSSWSLIRLVSPTGHDEEEADRRAPARRRRCRTTCRPRSPVSLLGQLRVGRDAQRLEADRRATRPARRRRGSIGRRSSGAS